MLELIEKMLNQLDIQKSHYNTLQRYYEGENPYIEKKKKADSLIENHKVIISYPSKIVDTKLGYVIGKEVAYTSKIENDMFLEEIHDNFIDWEHLHNVNLAKKAGIHGVSYEMRYVDREGNFKCTSFTPAEMIVKTDGTTENRVELAVRRFNKEFDDTDYIEVITDKEIIIYRYNKNFEQVSRKSHIFSRCPVSILYNNNESKGDFEKVISLVNALSYIISRNVDEVSYTASAYFVLEGVMGTDKEKVLEMTNKRIILTPEGSKVYFANKDLKADFNEKLLERIKNEIIRQSNIADISMEALSSNVSGVALKTKLQDTENIASIFEANFKSLLYDRLKMFAEFLRIKNNIDYSQAYKNIFITLSRNVPTNIKEIADITAILDGIVSRDTLLANNPWVTDVDLEKERVAKFLGSEMSPDEIKELLKQHLQEEKE